MYINESYMKCSVNTGFLHRGQTQQNHYYGTSWATSTLTSNTSKQCCTFTYYCSSLMQCSAIHILTGNADMLSLFHLFHTVNILDGRSLCYHCSKKCHL